MRLGKRERAKLKEREALSRAQRIKSQLVPAQPGKYAGANHMARICSEKYTKWGHSALSRNWEYDSNTARRVHRVKRTPEA